MKIGKGTFSIDYISSVAMFLVICLQLVGSVGTIYIDLDDMELIRIASEGNYWKITEKYLTLSICVSFVDETLHGL